MEMLIVVNLNEKLSYDQWAELYEADSEIRSAFMSNSIHAKVSDHQAMVKFSVTNPEAMQSHMEKNAPRFEELGISHEAYTITPAH